MIKRVEMRGTWSRTDTDKWEVTQYRRLMRERVAANGGTFDAVCPRAQPDDGSMEGTFHVSLPVCDGYASDRQTIKAAKLVFQAIMAMTMCRPPKVKFTKAEVYNIFAYQQGDSPLEPILVLSP